MATRASSRSSTDHEEIRRWAEDRGGKPACVSGTGNEGDIGILRIEFPGAPGANDQSLKPISWDDWFEKFDERGLALLVQDQTAQGQKSNFNKLVSRGTANVGRRAPRASRSASGSRSTSRSRKARSAASSGTSQQGASRSGRRLPARKKSKSVSRRKKATKSVAAKRKSRARIVSASKRKEKARSRRAKKVASGKRLINLKSKRVSARSKRASSTRGRDTGRSNRRAA